MTYAQNIIINEPGIKLKINTKVIFSKLDKIFHDVF